MRTTTLSASPVATEPTRTDKTRGWRTRGTLLAMVGTLCPRAVKRWQRLWAVQDLTEGRHGMPVKEGLRVEQDVA